VKVVSLLPSTTEIVFALERGEDLVGVTFECDFPPEARNRRVVSTSALPEGLSPREIDAVVAERMAAGQDLYKLDEGALADLDADLVLTQDLCAVCAVDVDRVDDALEYLGCRARVLTVDPSTLDGVLDSILDVGTALDAEPEARDLVAALRGRLDDLEQLLDDAPRRGVLLLEWVDPPFSAGHWVPDVVAAGGGRPVLAHPGANSQRLSWDAVSGAPADAVMVAPCGYHLEPAYEQASELVASGGLPAGSEVWAVDADAYFVRPGPRLVDGAELVGQILHPGLCGAPAAARARRVPAG
jgi:iron complex transport system substrate-binding protein